eukprot:TRINITY_DN12935_c0_g1_i1.p1 TRINITY_DN12935_c0_g1~~TRINITY_DN12935_c0_g1_i1.p1  ORF type:complete len:267 (-),score=39.23 TRINITY_DN12935_c0_g1_i1:463-1263(-)
MIVQITVLIWCLSCVCGQTTAAGVGVGAGAVQNGQGSVCEEGAPGSRIISVVGYGTVSVPSDMATISLSIEGQATTVNEARNLVADSSARVSKALQDLQPAENIYPISVTIVPQQSEVRTDDGQILIIIDGYKYSNSIDVEIHNVTSLSIAEVLDSATLAGQQAVNIQRIAFSLSPDVRTQASKIARRIAVEDAVAKAQEYAKEINAALGAVTSISEYPPNGSQSATSLPGTSPIKLGGIDQGMNAISTNELTATIYVMYNACSIE